MFLLFVNLPTIDDCIEKNDLLVKKSIAIIMHDNSCSSTNKTSGILNK